MHTLGSNSSIFGRDVSSRGQHSLTTWPNAHIRKKNSHTHKHPYTYIYLCIYKQTNKILKKKKLSIILCVLTRCNMSNKKNPISSHLISNTLPWPIISIKMKCLHFISFRLMCREYLFLHHFIFLNHSQPSPPDP